MMKNKQIKKAQVTEESLEKLRASFRNSQLKLGKLFQENISNEKKEFEPKKIE